MTPLSRNSFRIYAGVYSLNMNCDVKKAPFSGAIVLAYTNYCLGIFIWLKWYDPFYIFFET